MLNLSSRIKQKLIFIYLFAFSASIPSVGRNINTPSGARAAGMGDAFVSQSDTWSLAHNQAGLSSIKSSSFGLFYENRYFVKEFSTRSIAAVFPTHLGTYGLLVSVFGPSKWMETQASLSYSKMLSQKLSIGIAFNYFGTKLPESNTSIRAAGFDVGVIYKLTAKTIIGAHASNPLSTELKTLYRVEKLPYRIRAGGHTNFAKNFTMAYEIEKNESPKLHYKAGVEWLPVSNFAIRFGMNSNPSTFSVGMGYFTRRISTDFAFRYHQNLGTTPSFTITISL